MTAGKRALVIAGTHSGVGKTTVTLGLMAALKRRGYTIQGFKVGPDFIDPGHHRQVTGRPSRNVDGWMLSREENQTIFQRAMIPADVGVVEGVMGLFDGYDGLSEAGSTAQMAKWLGLPVVLVVDARSLARSAGALVHGYATFDPELPLSGVIFNRVAGERHLDYLRQVMDQRGQARLFGGIPREAELTIPERHLGLLTTEEHPLDADFLGRLADVVEQAVDVEGLWAALPAFQIRAADGPPLPAPRVRLGVARDAAFCFYYPENWEWLERCGAELAFFSPLRDPELPPDIHGLYLGGGYPEVFAERLAANAGMRRGIKAAAAAGLPVYAECGGLMYVGEEIVDLEGRSHPMAGVLPLSVRMLPRLKSLGYREVTLTADCLLGEAGAKIRGHEFHYSELQAEPLETVTRLYKLAARGRDGERREGYSRGQVLASYVHLHFGSNPEAARHLVAACRGYKERQ